MRRLALFPLLFILACTTDGDPLGGQEGEPIAPPPAAEPPAEGEDPDFDAGNIDCTVSRSCEGPGWCADYSSETAPADLDTACEDAGGTPSDTPCDNAANAGFCRDAASLDSCTVVWVFDDLAGDAAEFCDDIGLELVSPRG